MRGCFPLLFLDFSHHQPTRNMESTMRKPHAARKLSVAKAGKVQHQVQVCVDRRTTDNIASAKTSYKAILGHSVSTSVIMRRGVDLLARYLQQVHGEEWTKDELAYLMRSVR